MKSPDMTIPSAAAISTMVLQKTANGSVTNMSANVTIRGPETGISSSTASNSVTTDSIEMTRNVGSSLSFSPPF